MDQKIHDSLEAKVEEHSLQIQQLHDEVDFKKWKIDSLIEKIDNLTTVVQQIQLNQIEDDNDIKNRVIAWFNYYWYCYCIFEYERRNLT